MPPSNHVVNRRKARRPAKLAARWNTLRTIRPAGRPPSAASLLGTGDLPGIAPGGAASAIAAAIGAVDGDVVRLDTSAPDLLYALSEVGACTAVTRNDHAICAVRGRYRGIALGLHTAELAGEGIELDVINEHWHLVFAIDGVDPRRPGQRRRSIQVFDRAGNEVHRVDLEPDGDVRTWDAIVLTRTAIAPQMIKSAPSRRDARADQAIDRERLIAGWEVVPDERGVAALLARLGATRLQALRLAGEPRARRVDDAAIDRMLAAAASSGAPIAISVGNRGSTQRFAGPIGPLARHGAWLDVVDPGRHLHVRTDRIGSSWVVSPPGSAPGSAALELFDGDGEPIAVVRGGDPRWQAQLAALPAPRR